MKESLESIGYAPDEHANPDITKKYAQHGIDVEAKSEAATGKLYEDSAGIDEMLKKDPDFAKKFADSLKDPEER
jgi:hypothetical protein